MPELRSDDVAAAVVHYRDVLGFRLDHDGNQLTFGQPL